jgi:hypothetical protein
MARSLRGRLLLFGTLLVIAVAALAGPLATPGRAVDGVPATSSTAQVRLLLHDALMGGGTLVDRNWVLTETLPSNNPASYSFRYGVIDNASDHNDQTNVRRIDRIVLPPGGGGVSMLHFADPVPENLVMRHLATRPPERVAPVYVFGWSTTGGINDGTTLRVAQTVVYDPVADANAALRRADDAEGDFNFAEAFPEGRSPIVIDLLTDVLDRGSGIFAPRGVLIAVNSTVAPYTQINETGRPYGEEWDASYEQPVWVYRQWILDTINGAGSSGSAPAPPGRGLAETPRTRAAVTGKLPMTPPPQTGLCPAAGSCVESDPGWKAGVLLGAGNYRGAAEARCAAAAGNACSFGGAATPAGAAARLPLGPASAPTAPGTREVMVWCKTTAPFPDAGSPAQPVLRVSLTNADPSEVQPGFGWWDVTPGQAGTTPSATGQTQLDPATLPAC